MQKVLQHDFPEQWPDFMDVTLQLLNANDANSVFAGLQCLLAICRVYRFRAGEKRSDFDKIVEISFPQLLNIGNGLVDETSLEAAEMLRIVVKAYKHAIYVCLVRLLLLVYIPMANLICVVRTIPTLDGTPGHCQLVHALFEDHWKRAADKRHA